jgi:hypothetical protein
MEKIIKLLFILSLNVGVCQKKDFWIYPDFGYTYQGTHCFSSGVHLGIAEKDSLNYLQNTYAFVLRGVTNKHIDSWYFSPSFGFRGYNYLFGAHHGISYELNLTNYHAFSKVDWLLTPEVGFAFGGFVNLIFGYSFNLDNKDLNFYNNLLFSLRLTL